MPLHGPDKPLRKAKIIFYENKNLGCFNGRIAIVYQYGTPFGRWSTYIAGINMKLNCNTNNFYEAVWPERPNYFYGIREIE